MTDDSSPPQDNPLDDWDLDDDELSLGETIKPSPIGIPARKPPEEASAKDSALEKPLPAQFEPAPGAPLEPKSEPKAMEPSRPMGSDSLQPTTSAQQRPQVEPKINSSTATVLEKISLLLVTLTFLALAYWGISTFLSEAPEGELIEFTTDFPVEGQKVTIQSVETWWRSPVTTGDQIDVGVVIDTELIPCAKIVLDAGKSTTLQASFRDGEGKLMGDTLNLVVDGGKFTRSNSSEITIHGTAGFFNASEINPYVNGDTDPWSLIIVESEDPQTEVIKARVSKKRLEN